VKEWGEKDRREDGKMERWMDEKREGWKDGKMGGIIRIYGCCFLNTAVAERKAHDEGAAFAGLALDFDRTAVVLDDPVHEVEAVSYTHLTLPTIYSV
jgi:hypothetical protein